MSTDRPAAGLGRSIASVVLNAQDFQGMLETDTGKFYIMDVAKLDPSQDEIDMTLGILDRFLRTLGSTP